MTNETEVAPAVPVNGTPEAPSPNAATEQRFPTEPFPCPHCGQMLGPGVRVCVACHEPIDPAQIKPVTISPPAPQFVPRAQPLVRFPWVVFIIFLVMGSIMTSQGALALGPLRALLVIGAIQVMSSIWVFYDAHQKGIPKPLHWGIGSLFFWLPIFSWYLVRRRQPRAACPPIEAGAWHFLRTLLLIFAVTMFLTLILSFFFSPGRNPFQPPQPSQPAAHSGSIAMAQPQSETYSRLGSMPAESGD